LNELTKPQGKEPLEGDAVILAALDKMEGKENLWPEIVRIIFIHFIGEQPEIEPDLLPLAKKLKLTKPESYVSEFSQGEKTTLLMNLISLVHDLDSFRTHLNSRNEEKSGYNKQKQDILGEIKQMDKDKEEIIKKNAKSDFMKNNEETIKKIDALEAQLLEATRTEAKTIRQQINMLTREKNQVLNEMDDIEDKITKKRNKIDTLNDKIFKTSVKTSQLGRDSDKNEYWYFKEEPSKVFVKKTIIYKPNIAETDGMKNGNEVDLEKDKAMLEMREKGPDFQWFYYEHESEIESLFNSLNPKGIRERKLIEFAKKILDKLKVKTGKVKEGKEGEEDSEEGKEEEDQKKEEMMMEVEQEEAPKMHKVEKLIFKGGDRQQITMSLVWFG
jgi:hypothetical protein